MAEDRKLRTRITLVAVSYLALGVANVAVANSGFSGKVCPMLTEKVVASVHVPTKCAQQKTVTTSVMGAQETAVWGKNTLVGPGLSISVAKPSAAFLQAAQSHHGSGKSIRIGSWSSSDGLANGKTADSVAFIKDGYYVIIALETGPDHPLQSEAPFIALGKVIAKQL